LSEEVGALVAVLAAPPIWCKLERARAAADVGENMSSLPGPPVIGDFVDAFVGGAICSRELVIEKTALNSHRQSCDESGSLLL